MTMTKPLSEQIITLALGIERGDIYPHSAGRKLRALAEQVRALESERLARLSAIAASGPLADSSYRSAPHD